MGVGVVEVEKVPLVVVVLVDFLLLQTTQSRPDLQSQSQLVVAALADMAPEFLLQQVVQTLSLEA